jgi:micrococcal nuclease
MVEQPINGRCYRSRIRRGGAAVPWVLVVVAFLSTLAYVNRERYLAPASGTVSARFELCGNGARTDCVVDGDTIWLKGVKIRVADIDAPELHPSRCPQEEQLGTAAKLRLQALLNVGPFSLRSVDRDIDRYGRELRVLLRDGKSLGETLVDEGLARRWIGHRDPWC